MPKQIFSKDDFIKLADGAIECLIVRRKDEVKIKLRLSRMLYVYVTNASEVDEILKEIKVNKIEF